MWLNTSCFACEIWFACDGVERASLLWKYILLKSIEVRSGE